MYICSQAKWALCNLKFEADFHQNCQIIYKHVHSCEPRYVTLWTPFSASIHVYVCTCRTFCDHVSKHRRPTNRTIQAHVQAQSIFRHIIICLQVPRSRSGFALIQMHLYLQPWVGCYSENCWGRFDKAAAGGAKGSDSIKGPFVALAPDLHPDFPSEWRNRGYFGMRANTIRGKPFPPDKCAWNHHDQGCQIFSIQCTKIMRIR
jgi:hypothetical protein